jgi:hypothetical protein
MKRFTLKSLAIATLVLLTASAAPAHAQCAAPKNVSGTWSGSDQGVYRLHVVGNVIWWMGESKDNGVSWTNVFRGTRNGDIIEGDWADVRGKFWGYGTLKLRISATTFMEKIGATGKNFGATKWGRGGCNDTAGVGVKE